MKHYTFIDYATQAYVALVGLLIWWFHGDKVPHWPLLLLWHALCLGLIHMLISVHAAREPGRLLGFMRHFYPVLLYAAFYRETGALNHMFVSNYLDPFFIRLEERIFGFQPCLMAMEWLPYLLVSEVFYAAYFSYYIMIAGIGLALFLSNRERFFHYVSVVSFVFYACYLVYIFLPVMGPRVFFREIDGYVLPPEARRSVAPMFAPAVQSGLFYQVMALIYRCFEAPGAAFPSSHVAVAICTLWFSFLYLPSISRLHSVVVVLLCLSTVYCRYHYVVDVIAGAIAAAALVPLGNRMFHRCRQAGRPKYGLTAHFY
jgi:membrane-associated phospholipid phosphatase